MFVLHTVMGLGLVSVVAVDFAFRAASSPLSLLVSAPLPLPPLHSPPPPPRALRAGIMASFIPFGSSKQIFLVFPLLCFSSEFADCFHSESLAVFPVFLSKRKNVQGPPTREAGLGGGLDPQWAAPPLWWWQVSHLNPHRFLS